MSTSVINETGPAIDPQVTIRQIRATDSWRMIRLGARDLYWSERDGYIQFDTSGLGRKVRVIVKLATDDTYTVEIGRMGRKDHMPEYQVLEQVRGINAAELGQTVEALAVKHAERRR